MTKKSKLDDLELLLGHRFADRGLLDRALIHRSWSHERGTPGVDSESMEFLGDAVLSLAVSRIIFEAFGEVEMGLGSHLKLGRGEERGGGCDKDSLLADVYEAVLAAVYLDGGLDAVAPFISRQFAEQVPKDCVIMTQSSLSTRMWLRGLRAAEGKRGSQIDTEGDRRRWSKRAPKSGCASLPCVIPWVTGITSGSRTPKTCTATNRAMGNGR